MTDAGPTDEQFRRLAHDLGMPAGSEALLKWECDDRPDKGPPPAIPGVEYLWPIGYSPGRRRADPGPWRRLPPDDVGPRPPEPPSREEELQAILRPLLVDPYRVVEFDSSDGYNRWACLFCGYGRAAHDGHCPVLRQDDLLAP